MAKLLRKQFDDTLVTSTSDLKFLLTLPSDSLVQDLSYGLVYFVQMEEASNVEIGSLWCFGSEMVIISFCYINFLQRVTKLSEIQEEGI